MEKKASDLSRVIVETLEEFVVAITIIVLVFSLIFRIVTVSGYSMVPNFNDGDRVLVLGADTGYKMGDVVIVTNVLPEPIIKRVIATEGQVVDFDTENRMVLVDNVPVDDSRYGLDMGITTVPFNSFDALEFPQTVPEGCVFVLGDNRLVSEDSRYKSVGMIDSRNILGKAIITVFPFSSIGVIG